MMIHDSNPDSNLNTQPIIPDEVPMLSDHLASRSKIPRPGPTILGSFLWCLSLWGVMIVSMIGVSVIDLMMKKNADPQFMDRVSQELRAYQETQQMGPLLSRSLGLGFLGAGLATLLYTLLIVWKQVGTEWTRKLAIRVPRLDHLILVLIALPALMFLHGAAHHLANQLFGVDAKEADMTGMLTSIVEPWPRWLTILVIGVAPGLSEELWCRGFLGRGLLARYGWITGVLLTSLFFGMLHLSPPYALGTAVMGACLHFTYVTTRSLWVPILLHTLNNSLTVLVAVGDIPLQDVDPDQVASLPLYLASGFLLLVVGWTLFQSRGYLQNELGERVQPPFPTVAIPSERSGLKIVHEAISLWGVGMVVVAAVLFGWSIYETM